jgi:hypothetical protein
VKSEVLTAAKMSMLIFWVATPFEFAGTYQRFGETYCLLLQGFNGQIRTALQTKSIYRRPNHQLTCRWGWEKIRQFRMSEYGTHCLHSASKNTSTHTQACEATKSSGGAVKLWTDTLQSATPFSALSRGKTVPMHNGWVYTSLANRL